MIQEYNVREIITDPEKLSDWAEVIHPKKEGKLCQQIIGELKATMRANNLEYLTAPQIGYNKRVFCIRFNNKDYRTFLNASISNTVNITIAREECNSIPGKRFIIPRFNTVEVIYYTPMGEIEARKVMGRSAHILHHCVDHLDGTLTSDIGLEIDDLFDNATDEEREEVIKMYLEALDLRQKELQEEIQSDGELKKMSEAIDFMESVRKGETVVEPINEKKVEDAKILNKTENE
jgi:peptide deformylase